MRFVRFGGEKRVLSDPIRVDFSSGPSDGTVDIVDSKAEAFESENMADVCNECAIPGYIYFVADLEHAVVIKIGWSKEWGRRMATLQSGYPWPLEPLLVIPGTTEEEHALHQCFAGLKVKAGRGEWFHATEMICSFIGWLQGRVDGFDPSFMPMVNLRGRPNQLDPEVQIRLARTVTR